MFYPELAETASSPSMMPPDLSLQREKNRGLCSGHGLPTWSPQPCGLSALVPWTQNQEIGFWIEARLSQANAPA